MYNITTLSFLSIIFLAKLSLADELKQSVELTNFEDKSSNLNNGFPSYDKALQNKRGSLESSTRGTRLKEVKRILSKFLSKWKKRERRGAKKPGQTKPKQNPASDQPKEKEPKWHSWTNWSTCSVTCGKGRVIRWRHCRENCNDLETEMEEKSCQLPACEHKLFGVIKL